MKLKYRDILYNDYFTNQSSQKEHLEDTLKNRKYYNDYFLNRFLPQNKEIRILDLGCGYGSMLASLKGLDYKDFTGVDASKEAISLLKTTDLKEKVIETEIIEFLEKSIEQNSTWDVVLAIDILEHFDKDELVYILSLLKKTINSKGKLIIKIPNIQSPCLSGEIAFGDFTHEVFVTPASLKQVLTSCGFSKIETYEACPIPHTLMSSLRYFLWRIIRVFYTFIYAIETGSYNNSMIWSRSFFAVARN